MKKRQKDLVKGDIIEVVFGDYDNHVTVIVDKVLDEGGYYQKIECRYLSNNKPEIMYGSPNDLVDVIGREEESET